ncbi:MAG: putative O-glycosylation ligase, exosortase A system-associated [Rubrivivax sp.]|nr:putative O-glycosylation ligase, exosortase A system-associated [Rubrivivax sp.]
MRDVLMVLLFATAGVAALRRPYWGALLWVWIGLMNPHKLAYGFAQSLPFAMATVIVVALGMLMHPKEVRRPSGALVGILMLFIIWMTITTAFAIVQLAAFARYTEVLKVLGMTLVVASLVHTREQIMGLIWVVAGSIAFYGIKGGVFTILTGGGYRVWGPPSSVVAGNNELAVALITVIPLLYFLGRHAEVARDFVLVRFLPARWLRIGMYVSCVLCAVSALGSQSRGALLAIAAMSSMLWWRSRSKILLACVFLALVPIGLSLMPASWFERMNTIQTYEEDVSALGRLNAWQTAINIARDRITGAGPVTATPTVFAMYSPRQGPQWILVAHSIYFQILGDHGYIGLGIYLLFWVISYRMAGRVVRLSAKDPGLAWVAELGNMAKVSMVGFGVGGAFLSVAYWDMPYYIPVILAATERLLRESPAEARMPSLPAADTGPPGALASRS